MPASIVTGAKVVATGSALTHYTSSRMSACCRSRTGIRLVFLVPTNAQGVKFICRVSNEQPPR